MEKPKNNKTGAESGCVIGFVCIIVVFLCWMFGSCISCGSSSHSSHSGDTETCPICNRTFQSDSENAKSIRWTGMCTNCYNNYKYARDALKERPLN